MLPAFETCSTGKPASHKGFSFVIPVPYAPDMALGEAEAACLNRKVDGDARNFVTKWMKVRMAQPDAPPPTEAELTQALWGFFSAYALDDQRRGSAKPPPDPREARITEIAKATILDHIKRTRRADPKSFDIAEIVKGYIAQHRAALEARVDAEAAAAAAVDDSARAFLDAQLAQPGQGLGTAPVTSPPPSPPTSDERLVPRMAPIDGASAQPAGLPGRPATAGSAAPPAPAPSSPSPTFPAPPPPPAGW